MNLLFIRKLCADRILIQNTFRILYSNTNIFQYIKHCVYVYLYIYNTVYYNLKYFKNNEMCREKNHAKKIKYVHKT